MKRKKRHWLDYIQICLMLGCIIAAIMLIVDWKKFDFCFCIEFGLASVLFFLNGVLAVTGDRKKSRFGIAAVYFAATAVMLGIFFNASILAILGV